MSQTAPPSGPARPSGPHLTSRARIPHWMARARARTLQDAAFLSGAALAWLDMARSAPDLPARLWRARLALAAAETCAAVAGRQERATGLRDALHLTPPGAQAGPAGEILRQWTRAVAEPVSVANLVRALPGLAAPGIAAALQAAGGDLPVTRAAGTLEHALHSFAHNETAALILADARLAQAMGWDHLVPLLAIGLTPDDLHKQGEALRLACHAALPGAARQAADMAADLGPRAAALRAVAPKLRAKGAAQAVALFLSQDAVSPAGLGAILPDRAARRLCDRLVTLGVLRELTGRDSFRLYGL